MKTKTISALVVVLVAAVMAYMASADTQCGSQDCSVNTTLTVGNSNPTITEVQSGINITGTAETSVTTNVLFNVTDGNGYGDLNDSTAQCVGYKSLETNRTSSSCTAQDQSGNDLRYNCSVDFQYYDAAAADWKWDCSVSDNSWANVSNSTVTFTINALNYVDVNVSTFNWASATANTDDQEADTAINLDNGGNQDYETALVTAYNATDGSNIIPATAFYLNNVTGDAAGTQMADSTAANITTWFTLQHGNAASEDLFAYVDMPSVPSGSYSSTSNWLIDITTT